MVMEMMMMMMTMMMTDADDDIGDANDGVQLLNGYSIHCLGARERCFYGVFIYGLVFLHANCGFGFLVRCLVWFGLAFGVGLVWFGVWCGFGLN